MKRFIAVVLAGVMVASMVSTAAAQAAGPRGGGGQQGGAGGGQRGGMARMDQATMTGIHNRVVATLNLTAAQKTAVAAAVKKNQAAMDKLRKDNQGKDFSKMSEADRKKMRDANQKIRSAYEADMKKAMGAKYATYQQKYQAELQKEMAKRGGGGMNMNLFTTVHNRVVAGLGLTATQKQGVAAADKKYKASLDAFQKQAQAKPMSQRSEAERKKMMDGLTAARTTHTSALKKAMGDKKFAEYQKKLEAEMKKEMDKMRGGQRGGAAPPSGRGA